MVWFRGSSWNLIEDTEKYDVEISQNKECHFITLFNVNTSDSGKYSCMAVNAKHEIWHEFELNVEHGKCTFWEWYNLFLRSNALHRFVILFFGISYLYKFSLALLDINTSVQRSSPKIDSFCQINDRQETRDDAVFDENPNQKIEGREFNIKEFDMIQLLCKISQDNCFPEPRVIFYNKQNKRMQNNENINIGKLHFYEYKRRLLSIQFIYDL